MKLESNPEVKQLVNNYQVRNIWWTISIKTPYLCCLFLALVSSPEYIEWAGVGVALVNIHNSEVNI